MPMPGVVRVRATNSASFVRLAPMRPWRAALAAAFADGISAP